MDNYLKYLGELTANPETYMPHSKAVLVKSNVGKFAKEMGFNKWKNLMVLVVYYKANLISMEYITDVFLKLDTYSANDLKIAYEVGIKRTLGRSSKHG